MFKKRFKLSAENQLSGKDKKQLRARLAEIVGPLTAGHFVDNSRKLVGKKVQGSKLVILTEEDNPMVVDLSGALQDLCVTVYFLMAYPDCLPRLVLRPGVEDILAGGANLMWPGVS
jgi:predicted ribosome-associated RNA-binding protein Tma20